MKHLLLTTIAAVLLLSRVEGAAQVRCATLCATCVCPSGARHNDFSRKERAYETRRYPKKKFNPIHLSGL